MSEKARKLQKILENDGMSGILGNVMEFFGKCFVLSQWFSNMR